MAERNGASGRTPGSRPGGGRGPAAASSIKVDTTDVQKLRKLIGDTAKDAEKLGTALTKYNTSPLASLKAITAEVKSLRTQLAGAGTGRASRASTATGGGGGSVGSANGHAGNVPPPNTLRTRRGNNSYLPGGGNQGGGGGAGGGGSGHWTVGLSRPMAAAALGIAGSVSGLSSLMAGHQDAAIDRSYLLNRYSLMTGRGMGYGAQMNVNRGLASQFGNNTLGYADTTAAMGTLMASGATSGALGQSRVASAGFASALNPMNGAQGGAAMTARVFTPQNYYKARLAGINTMAGGKNDLQSFMDQIINRYEGMVRRKLTDAEIQSGNQPGMPLYLTLTGMGFADDGDRQNLLTYWAARNRTGKTGTAALSAAGANTGLFKSAQNAANARGNALSRADVGGMKGMQQGFDLKTQEYKALGALADTPFGRVMTDATGVVSVFSKELKTVNGLIETLIGGAVIRRLLGGAGAGGGLGGLGGLGRGAGGGGGPLPIPGGGSGGGTGRLAGLGAKALRAGAIGFVGNLAASAITASGHETTGRVLGDAATGAALGSFLGPAGTVVGGIAGAGVGLASSFTAHQNSNDLKKLIKSMGTPDGMASAQKAYVALHKMATAKDTHGVPRGALQALVNQFDQAFSSYGVSPAGGAAGGPAGSSSGPGASGGNNGARANTIIHTAEQFLGTMYRWGGSSPKTGFDCSGLTQYSYGKAGVRLPRTAAQQQRVGKAVAAGDVQAGDLMFLGSPAHHVMMSIGGGKVIQAPHTGARVDIRNFPASAATSIRRILGGGNNLGGGGSNSGGDAGDTSGVTTTVGSAAGSLIGTLFGTSSGGSLLSALASLTGGRGAAGGSGGRGAHSSATSGGVGTSPAPSNVTGNVALGKKMAAARGWVGKQWDALYWLWNQESGWRTNAGSPAHAYGIPQSLPGSKMRGAGADWMTNPATQIRWGEDYISGKYHDPIGAVAHKHATRGQYGNREGWYESGKWELVRDELANLHRGEMVVPAQPAEKIRQAIDSGGTRGKGSRTVGGRTIPVQLVFMVQNGSDAEMRKAARRFVQYVEEDKDITMVASS